MAAPPVDVPCSLWTDDASVRECCVGLDPLYDLTDDIAFATAILYRLSGRQFPGICTRTVWICSDTCGCCDVAWGGNNWFWLFNPYPSYPVPTANGDWINVGTCNDRCSLERVKLPATVNNIIEVTADGAIVPPTSYRIEAYRWLVRTDGEHWPCSSNLVGDPGDPGVFTVEYEYGKPVPIDGQIAAAAFACELAKSRCGRDNCLPARLKHIDRQGVSLDFADPLDFLDNGKTGIYLVDLWLASVNPSKLKRRARVHRPDRPGKRVTYTG